MTKKKPTTKKSVRRTKIQKITDYAKEYYGGTDFPEGRDQMYPPTPPTAYWKMGV